MLARDFHRPDRRRMLAEMPAAELMEWAAWYAIEANPKQHITPSGRRQSEADMEAMLSTFARRM